MARKFSELYNKMPAASRQRVEERVQEFHQTMALDEVRRARKLTQVELARKLKVDQGAVSKIEKRADMYVSTLRSHVEAMGGTLQLRAVFPDAALDVSLKGQRTATAKARPAGTKTHVSPAAKKARVSARVRTV